MKPLNADRRTTIFDPEPDHCTEYNGVTVRGLARNADGETVAFMCIDQDDESGVLTDLFGERRAAMLAHDEPSLFEGTLTFLVAVIDSDLAQRLRRDDVPFLDAFTSGQRTTLTLPVRGNPITTTITGKTNLAWIGVSARSLHE